MLVVVLFCVTQVSLLEYRNRSRNRLSVDLPRPPPPPPPSNAPATAPCVTPSSAFSSSVIKSSSLSSSLPNLSAPSTTSSLVHRSVSSSGEMNGPHLEPVSPDLEDKSGKGKRNPQSLPSCCLCCTFYLFICIQLLGRKTTTA